MKQPASARLKVDIREADFDDPMHCAAIIELLNAYASEPGGGGTPLRAEVRERLIPTLRSQPHALVLLALCNERPLGIAICFWGFSTFHARPLLNIHDLTVAADVRGRGVGRALLAAAEGHARRRGCCKLTLEVLEDNERARALYRSVGFLDIPAGHSAPTRFLTKGLGATIDP